MLLHRAAGGIGALLQVLVAHGGAQGAPMVQYVGNMGNAGGVLGAAQGQIMVLRAVECGTEASGFLHQPAPHNHQMTNIIATIQVIRAEIRLVMGRGMQRAAGDAQRGKERKDAGSRQQRGMELHAKR